MSRRDKGLDISTLVLLLPRLDHPINDSTFLDYLVIQLSCTLLRTQVLQSELLPLLLPEWNLGVAPPEGPLPTLHDVGETGESPGPQTLIPVSTRVTTPSFSFEGPVSLLYNGPLVGL